MDTVKRFEDLIVWQKSRKLAQEIFILSQVNKIKRDFGLRQQILNSSGSIPDNIAEGFERDGNKESKQFLSIAKGSAGELRSQLYRILDRTILTKDARQKLHYLVIEVSKMLSSMISNLNKNIYVGRSIKLDTCPLILEP